MAGKILRGRVLTFHRAPQDVDDLDALTYLEDGAIAAENGLIKHFSDFDSLPETFRSWPVTDHRPHLITAGFIDPHIHFPQVQVIASYAPNLLTWLNHYTFVEEQKFASASHAKRMARAFFDELLRHGTTTAAAFCSVHKASAEAFFAEAERRNLRMIGGKVMMDRNAPEALTDTPEQGYEDSKALIADWHGRGRLGAAITPRFAITSTPEQLSMASALAEEHPDCHIQTHLSENIDEIKLASELFPTQRDYTDVYQRFGLLRPNTLLGHAIHLSERERDALAETRAVAVHCPTSNLFLGSGLFDYFGLAERERPVRIATATDIGGGTSYSMLRTMDEAYKIQQLRGKRLDPLRSFYQITRGNAEALSLEDKIGSIGVGLEADLLVLDAGATPAMQLRRATLTNLAEELFLLQTMGDDRAIAEVYVAGEASRPASTPA